MSTATPMVLPLGAALVVAPVVLTPVEDTVTVLSDLVLLVVVVVVAELPPSSLDELLDANTHIGWEARAAARIKAATLFFFIAFPLLSTMIIYPINSINAGYCLITRSPGKINPGLRGS